MHDFLSTLILPLPILWLLILTGMAGYFFKRTRLTRIGAIGALIWQGLITTGLLPDFLVRSLERKYPPMLTIEKGDTTVATYVMVLGAGHTDDKSLPPNSQLSKTLLIRLIEGIRLYVVTDAIHMPRAMYLFTHEAVIATAAPTNYLFKKGSVSHPFNFLIPRSDNINRMEAAVHEYVGLLWARL